MTYLVYRPDGNLGPFSLEELRQQADSGAITVTDLAWHEGLPQWEPVANFLSGAASPALVSQPLAAASPLSASAEATRREYLSHEQNIRSIGTFFYFTGSFHLLLPAIILVSGLIACLAGATPQLVPLVIVVVEALVFGALGGLSLWSAGRFKRLERSAIVPGSIVAAIGLLGIPIGTLINGFILYLIHSDKGRVVFSDPYRAVVEATPEIKWKTALWVKLILGLMILAFISVVVISILIALGNQVHALGASVK